MQRVQKDHKEKFIKSFKNIASDISKGNAKKWLTSTDERTKNGYIKVLSKALGLNETNSSSINGIVEQFIKKIVEMEPEQLERIKSIDVSDVSGALKLVGDVLGIEDQLSLDAKQHLTKLAYKYKRGTGEYTEEQNSIYKALHDGLAEGKVSSLTTRTAVSSSASSDSENNSSSKNDHGTGEMLSKGLIGGHEYQVVDCYERDGHKFALIRNPWGVTARDYKREEKQVEHGTISVLSAHGEEQKASFSPMDEHSSARGLSNHELQNNFQSAGYMEIELSDLAKRFQAMTIADLPLNDMRSNNTHDNDSMKSSRDNNSINIPESFSNVAHKAATNVSEAAQVVAKSVTGAAQTVAKSISNTVQDMVNPSREWEKRVKDAKNELDFNPATAKSVRGERKISNPGRSFSSYMTSKANNIKIAVTEKVGEVKNDVVDPIKRRMR